MKLPYPSLVRQMSGRSAIVEEGDSTLTIPSVLQPTYEMSSPLLRISVFPQLIADSFIEHIFYAIAGVGAFAATFFPTMKSGRWEVTFTYAFAFTGTSSVVNFSELRVFDDLVNGKDVIRFNHVNGSFLSGSFSMPLLLVQDGWFFEVDRGITVALDVLTLSMTMHARRIF